MLLPVHKHFDDLEALWEALLSRQPGRIRAAFATLSLAEQAAVRAHLMRMASEPGWHEAQRAAARAALAALDNQAGSP